MEKRENRDTAKWTNISPHGPKKDVNYDTSNLNIKKESFNYGSVPFGSHSKQQFLYQSRVTHNLPTAGMPGPGSYGTAISPRDDIKAMGRKLSPGFSFSKLGMSSDHKKTRQMPFNESMTATSSKPSKA